MYHLVWDLGVGFPSSIATTTKQLCKGITVPQQIVWASNPCCSASITPQEHSLHPAMILQWSCSIAKKKKKKFEDLFFKDITHTCICTFLSFSPSCVRWLPVLLPSLATQSSSCIFRSCSNLCADFVSPLISDWLAYRATCSRIPKQWPAVKELLSLFVSHISRRQQENCIGEAGSQGQEGREELHHSFFHWVFQGVGFRGILSWLL